MLEKRISQSVLACTEEDNFLEEPWRETGTSVNEDAPDFVPHRPPVALRSVARQLSRRWAVLESKAAPSQSPTDSEQQEFSFLHKVESSDLTAEAATADFSAEAASFDDEHYLRASGEINRAVLTQNTEGDARLLGEMWNMVNANLSRSLCELNEAHQQLTSELTRIAALL